MVTLLTIISLILWAYIIAKTKPGIDFTKLITFTACGFFFSYTIISACFFWLDCFSFVSTLFAGVMLELVAIFAGIGKNLCSGHRYDRRSLYEVLQCQVTFDFHRYWIPIVIALLALPFTWNKFGLYSMGQDQGTYQVKALALMEYDTHNYMEMEEFTKLDTPDEKQKYLDFVYGQNNLYLPRVIEETETDASKFTNIVGTIHGLPTYSALLGLWGTIFGYTEMIGVQTVLYLCLIFLSFYVAESAGLKRVTSAMVTLLTAFSPIVLWGSKSSLTEVGLAVIFAVFLYCVVGEDENAVYAGAALAAFAFFHISIYVFMPILVIALLLMYVLQEERGWLWALLITLAGYLISAFWAFDIAPYYSYGNYSVLFDLTGGILNQNNIKIIIAVACAVCGALAVFLLTGTGEAWTIRLREKAQHSSLFSWCVSALTRLILLVSFAFFLYKGVITADYIRYCQYLQISTYIYMTGLLLIPFIYCYLLWKAEKALADKTVVVLVLVFFYCVIAYSMFMRLEVQFYYYYARYVTIFLLAVFLLAGMLLEMADQKGRISMVVLSLALLSFLPYDIGLVTQKDHTRCDWEVLGDVCEDITSEDAFIVGPDEQQIVFIFPVKLLTGCDVYYADEELAAQMKKLTKEYNSVYYLDYEGALEEKVEADPLWKDGQLSVQKVYTNWNHLSHLDYFHITNPLTPIPLNYVEYRLKLSMHEIQGAS